ncbi:hypothetical protein RFI_05158, partial [Reticulomyxa filosa]
FWLQLLHDFCNEFTLPDARPNDCANVIWSIALAQPHFAGKDKKIFRKHILRILGQMQQSMKLMDGRSLGIVLWAFSNANYQDLEEMRVEYMGQTQTNVDNNPLSAWFNGGKHSVMQRLSELIEAQQYTVHSNTLVLADDIIVILQSCTFKHKASGQRGLDMFGIPHHMLKILSSRLLVRQLDSVQSFTKPNLNYDQVLSLLQSLHQLDLYDDTLFTQLRVHLNHVLKYSSNEKWSHNEILKCYALALKYCHLHNSLPLMLQRIILWNKVHNMTEHHLSLLLKLLLQHKALINFCDGNHDKVLRVVQYLQFFTQSAIASKKQQHNNVAVVS